ncbi:MAG: glycosyltransferase family 4 protein [Oceanicaulis sp.]|nr:glycosyltransferase family 4 protein [Oceanicaulis sp.]
MKQIVYSPVKSPALIGKNAITFIESESQLIYSHILNNSIDKVFYARKISKIVVDIESRIEIDKIDIIHAHTWYSDGGVAYVLSKKYNIPYLVTIRNTDINYFEKYMIHKRVYGRKILSDSNYVILVAASYREKLFKKSFKVFNNLIKSRVKVIPNGVDPYWIENAVNKKQNTNKSIFRILYIGKFTQNKNVVNLQYATAQLNSNGIIAHLDLIGGGGDAHETILDVTNTYSHFMTYHGTVYELDKLKYHYEQADIFAMPSKHETFGLVYVEALLQGLPILFTKNEGIDGLYDERIGEKVECGSVVEIRDKLLMMINNYDSYCIPKEKILKNHDWVLNAKIYQDLYFNI